jgi:hypothetical protein
VDLRCYSLVSLRSDGKIALRLVDLGGFYHEWDIDSLPWDVVNPIKMGDDHPDVVDRALIDAITNRALSSSIASQPAASAAVLTFLYLYMIMTHDNERYGVYLKLRYFMFIAYMILLDLHSTSLHVLHYQLELV